MKQPAKVKSQKSKVKGLATDNASYWLPTTGYSGFTLLEVLVASTILSLILAALYGVFSQTLASKRLMEERAERARTARIALLRIGEDLQSALPPTESNLRFIGETRPSRDYPEDTLSFATLTRTASTNRAPEGDLNTIGYTLEPDPTDITQKQLVRRVRFALSTESRAADEIAPLLPQVQGLRFRFFNGRNWQDNWKSDSTQDGLPQAVEATVYVADARGKITPFATIFALPLAEKKRGRIS
jgi:type II secretion system protein J